MVSKCFDKSFHIIYFAVFAWVTLVAVCAVFADDFLGIVLGVGFIASSIFGVRLLKKHFGGISDKSLTRVFLIMSVVMFVTQMVLAFIMLCEPVTDWEVIDLAARSYAQYGNMEHIYDNVPESVDYLARYTNNNGITVLLSFYYRILYLIFGEVPLLAGSVLNTVFISLAVVFCFLTARKIFGNFQALMTMIICVLFLPYYTYCTYYYTDSMSIPFVILSIYLFVCGYGAQKLRSRILFSVFAGIACCVGYVLKGSVIMVLAAFVIYMIYMGGLKKFLAVCGSIVAGFITFTVIFNCIVSTLQIADDETLYKEKYPLTHWVMMGLQGNGGYNDADREFTYEAGDYDEKVAANIEEIGNRISDYGFGGMLEHIQKKTEFTWSDGTYWISHHIYEPYERTVLSEFFLSDGECYWIFESVSSGIHLSMLAMMCVSIWTSVKRRRRDYTMLLHIIAFGVYLFFLIWEARSRYLFNYTPVFILMWCDGFSGCLRLFKSRRTPKHLNRHAKT